MPNIWQRLNESAADSVQTVRDSLVQIVSEEGSIGAGTIWHGDGLILTNAHVALEGDRPRNFRVALHDGRVYDPQIIAYDAKRDLAALSINEINLPTIQLGNSRDLRPGQWLMAMGHPWGVLDAITAGIVIGTGDRLPEIGDDREWIALDMKMRPGHSGGPLFNSAGQLMGINTMIVGPEVSFAVPVDVVKLFLKEAFAAYEANQQQAVTDQPQTVV